MITVPLSGSQEIVVPTYSVSSAAPWHAIRTRSNHEKLAASCLQSKGFHQYLPVYRDRRRWSDRVVESEQPLFPGYVFCRFDARKRVPVISTPGVVSIVGFGSEPAPIPDEEIEAVRLIMHSGHAAKACPFLKEGQRVRIKYGALEGLEGILVNKKSEWRMIVSISMLQRSVSVEIDREKIATV